MKDLLEKANWTQIQSKRVDTQEYGIMPDGTNVNKVGYLIALTGFDKKADKEIMNKPTQQLHAQNSSLVRFGGSGKNVIMPTLKMSKVKSVQ